MNKQVKIRDGYHRKGDLLLFVRNNKLIYYFRIKLKPTPCELRQIEIREILRRTDELCGNRSGNDFITTQINYNG